MTTNRALLLLAIAAAILLAVGLKRCDKPKPKEQTRPEVNRQKSETANQKTRIIYVTNDSRLIAENNALKAKVATLEGKDKQATTKAQHSASKYAETPTLDNCKAALMDCQEEAGTKAAVITVLKQQVATVTEQRIADSSEINRLVLRADTLNQGWKDANAAVAKLKSKRWAVGVQVGYGIGKLGLSSYVGVGIQYSLIKF